MIDQLRMRLSRQRLTQERANDSVYGPREHLRLIIHRQLHIQGLLCASRGEEFSPDEPPVLKITPKTTLATKLFRHDRSIIFLTSSWG